MAPGWTEHTAPDGRKYYFNKASGKSVWEKPLADAATTPVPKARPIPQLQKFLHLPGNKAGPSSPARTFEQLMPVACICAALAAKTLRV